jgi:hypothetical protein
LTRISPSSAIFTSQPRNGFPIVPNLKSSGREIVAAVEVSVIPQPSSTSTPAASKKRRMSGLIGAAPVTASTMLPPNRLRMFASTRRSARSYWRWSRKPGLRPWRSTSRTFFPTPIVHQKIRFWVPPDFSALAVAAV